MNPARFHESVFGAIYASTGALLVNVLSGFQNNFLYGCALVSSFTALCCIIRVERLRSGALSEKDGGEKHPYEDIKKASIVYFLLGLFLLIISVLFVGWMNHNAEEKGSKDLITIEDLVNNTNQLKLDHKRLHSDIIEQRKKLSMLNKSIETINNNFNSLNNSESKSNHDSSTNHK